MEYLIINAEEPGFSDLMSKCSCAVLFRGRWKLRVVQNARQPRRNDADYGGAVIFISQN
ncbi:MAG: hypothetical protein IJ390_13935 [Lachnospiraceae bacterium]|nr:hypothetical protein [Lachnospiraceae bacterium]